MIPLPLYILAGGRSSRFGSDKARAVIQGQPLVCRVAEALMPVVSSITVVADAPGKYADLGLATIADAIPHKGPMGGLVAALNDRDRCLGPGWLLLASCDLLDPQPEWVSLLAAAAHGNRRVMLFRGQRLEPLLALYHTLVLPIAQRSLAQGHSALWRLVESVEHTALDLPGNLQRLPQINKPTRRSGYVCSSNDRACLEENG